jgi:hypothetical protein
VHRPAVEVVNFHRDLPFTWEPKETISDLTAIGRMPVHRGSPAA